MRDLAAKLNRRASFVLKPSNSVLNHINAIGQSQMKSVE
jgi:hypothetical protein